MEDKMSTDLIVSRLAPSIYNFQQCLIRCGVFPIDSGCTNYESFACIKLNLPKSPAIGNPFNILVRLVCSDINGKRCAASADERVELDCDLRVRQLVSAESGDCDQMSSVISNDDRTVHFIIGAHVADMVNTAKPLTELNYKVLARTNDDGDQAVMSQFLKPVVINRMDVNIIFSDISNCSKSDSVHLGLLSDKIHDILSTYNLHVKSHTLIDTRCCPLAKTSSIEFIYVRSITLKNATTVGDVNTIGRVSAKTKIRINQVDDIDYYLRQHMVGRTVESDVLERCDLPYIMLRNMIEMQLKLKARLVTKIGGIWNGILLAGPSGKSSLVRELSGKLGAKLIEFNFTNEILPSLSSTIVDHSIAYKKLDAIFNQAIVSSLKYPTILLLRQIHVLDTTDSGDGDNSGSRSSNNKKKLVNHLCALFDMITAKNKGLLLLTVIGSTDRVHLVPTKLRMYGRLMQEIYMNLPTEEERRVIVKSFIGSLEEFKDIDLTVLAKLTPGYSKADLAKLIHLARIKCVATRIEDNCTNFLLEMKDLEECIKNIHPSGMKSFLIDAPNVKWDDIGGQKDLKFKLKQAIEWPMKHPEAFKRLGITPPKGILLYGPPGCSKTMIVKAIATECGFNFFSVNGSELFSQWVGDSEKAVRTLFRQARQVSPCIIFFDEIDSLVGKRGSSSGVHERVIAQLLIEIDGIEQLKDCTIVAATNRPDIIDPALLRPGRLDRIVYVPLPDDETRKEIFQIHFRKMPVSQLVDIDMLVNLTKGYSGAELTAVCHESALTALERDIESTIVLESHFLRALELIPPRTTSTQIEFYENYSQRQHV